MFSGTRVPVWQSGQLVDKGETRHAASRGFATVIRLPGTPAYAALPQGIRDGARCNTLKCPKLFAHVFEGPGRRQYALPSELFGRAAVPDALEQIWEVEQRLEGIDVARVLLR